MKHLVFERKSEMSETPEGREVPPGVQCHNVISPICYIFPMPWEEVKHLLREGGILVLGMHETPLTTWRHYSGQVVLQGIPQEDVLHCPVN